MATDGPTPIPCDPDIFRSGKPVVALSGRSNAIERWVQAVAKMADARVDWHYSGGMAQVLHQGSRSSRKRVEAAIDKLEPTLNGRIMMRYKYDDAGLFRNGVTETPPDVVAGFVGPNGNQVYMVKSYRKK